MSYQPLGDRVVVKVVPRIEKTSGGILMPGVLQESLHKGPIEATVVSVGPDVKEVSAGEVVMIPKAGGTEVVDEDGEKIIVISETEVFGAFI